MNDKTNPADKAGKTRKKSTPETAQSVNLHIGDDEELRTKLLNILNVVRYNNKGINIPLSGALRYAVNGAHNAMFGDEFDDNPDGAFDAFKQRMEEIKARRRPNRPERRESEPDRSISDERSARGHHVAQAGKTPGEIAREAAEAKGDAARGIGTPAPAGTTKPTNEGE